MSAETQAEKPPRLALGKHLITQKFPIRWGEMDVMGHVNNAQYLRYFEESRTAWCEAIGRPLNAKSAAEHGMILLKATVTFKKPVTYPADATVKLHAAAVGNTSFELFNTLTVGDDPEPACIGEFVIVWFDYANGKPIRVPDEIRKLLT